MVILGVIYRRPFVLLIRIYNAHSLLHSFASFEPFVQKATATATFHIRSLVAIKDHFPRDLVRRLYASLVISRLDYYNAVLTGFQNADCSHFS